MAQADYVISPNPTGLAMRTEVNQIFQAILTNNSGSVAPTTTQAGMFWGDISNALTYYLKIRNHTNDGWVSLYAYDVATKTISPVNTPAGNISATTMQGAINELDTEKQATLVSGTNIKTINSTSLLGSGNVAVQESLVSGTNIKTVNSTSLLGSGDVAVQATLVSGTNIKTIGGTSILGSGDIVINTPISLPTKVAYNQISVDGTTLTLTSPTAGTDYYFSKTAITTSIQSDTIGGFHYGLTPSGETPTGNKTSADITAIAGINAYSIWTNWHRPNCDPRGMVKVGDIWVDIYLADSRYGIRKYSAPTSITGYKIAGGATDYGREIPLIPTEFGGNGSSNYGKLTWFQVNEIAKASGKRSLRYSEFPSSMYGVLEQIDSSSYDSGGGNIFHIAQLTSKFGIEQATGTQWVWGDDVQGIGSDGWKTGLTDSRGSIYAYTNQPTAVILGGDRDGGSNAGSRCSSWGSCVWDSNWCVGCRFACDHLKLV